MTIIDDSNLKVVGHVIQPMNFRKVNWGLSMLILASVTTFILTRKEFKDDNFKYGKDFNETRDSLGVPKIEADWITHESSPTRWYWAKRNKSVTTGEPFHLDKEAHLADNKIVTEEDNYNKLEGDSLGFRLVYKYRFENGTWECKFIKHRFGKYPPSDSWPLTLKQADSVLNNWGLRR